MSRFINKAGDKKFHFQWVRSTWIGITDVTDHHRRILIFLVIINDFVLSNRKIRCVQRVRENIIGFTRIAFMDMIIGVQHQTHGMGCRISRQKLSERVMRTTLRKPETILPGCQ